MALTVNETAAATRIAARLAPSVTNAIIDDLAMQLGFRPLVASNKAKKIHLLLECLISDRRMRPRAADAIATLVMHAHHRTVSGTAQMTVADADRVVEEMRTLGLAVGELGRSRWRDGLKDHGEVEKRARTPAPAVPWSPSSPDVLPQPQRHDEAQRYLSELVREQSASPQHRGRELEKIVYDVLAKERLRPGRNIVNPGEQIDLTFAIRDTYYLLESRWHQEPQGLPALRDFSEKVRRKAEGTFGVLLSMSGFARNINETASQGSRLNCVGITARELMLVMEGLRTFVDLVQAARHHASTRSLFYHPPD